MTKVLIALESPMEEERIISLLSERTLLVVEYDRELARRLCVLFKRWGIKEVVVRRCATGEEGALDLLVKREEELDAVCVDTMLPWDENALRTCDDLSEAWNKLQAEVAANSGGHGPGSRLSGVDEDNLRDRLNIVSKQMRAVIDREAGLKIIKQWLRPDPKGPLRVTVPVLFLTASQEESLKKEAEEIPGPYASELVKWVTKPATELQVVEALAELISIISIDWEQEGCRD